MCCERINAFSMPNWERGKPRISKSANDWIGRRYNS